MQLGLRHTAALLLSAILGTGKRKLSLPEARIKTIEKYIRLAQAITEELIRKQDYCETDMLHDQNKCFTKTHTDRKQLMWKRWKFIHDQKQ